MLRHDANPVTRDMNGYSPIHYAALNGHKLVLEMVSVVRWSVDYMDALYYSVA